MQKLYNDDLSVFTIRLQGNEIKTLYLYCCFRTTNILKAYAFPLKRIWTIPVRTDKVSAYIGCIVGFYPQDSSVSQSLILLTGSPEPSLGIRLDRLTLSLCMIVVINL